MFYHEAIEKTIAVLKNCKNLLFITGAGISADSGIPTYRGIGGLYNEMETEENMPIEVVLSGTMMATRPAITWKYLRQIEEKCRGAVFNRAHQVIAEMERHFPRVWTLTQNVDGFHHQAGAKNVIDIHGNMHQLYCTSCNYRETVEDYRGFTSFPPLCPKCRGYIRPDVVFFEEMLPFAKVLLLQKELDKGFDIVFSIGTSSLFPYITLPVIEAKRANIPTVEINPDTTNISALVDIKIAARASKALDEIWKRYRSATKC